MFGLGGGELTLILIVILLFFGGKKLPQLGGAMGKALTNFKKGLREGSKKEGPDAGDNHGNIEKKLSETEESGQKKD